MTLSNSSVNPEKQSNRILYIAIIILGLVILTVLAWSSYNSTRREREATRLANDLRQQVEKLNGSKSSDQDDSYDNWQDVSSPDLGLSMSIPKDWQFEPKIVGSQLQSLELSSKDLVLAEQEIGGNDVARGFLVNIYPIEQGDINTFSGLEASLKENGTLVPIKLSLGKYKAIQYSYSYEGLGSLYIRLQLDDSTFVTAELMSEGSEQNHNSFESLKKILSSISRI